METDNLLKIILIKICNQDMSIELDTIYNEDCKQTIERFDDNSIDCIVTSPPYYRLRDYGVDGQIGLEDTPDQYVAKLVDVFEGARRKLKKTGTLWLNLGDSYASSGKTRTDEQCIIKSNLNGGMASQIACKKQINKITGDLKPKDLIGIPWMIAFALRAAGWYLRQDIIWNKPNPMPESVKDRCARAHEYIFMLTKSAKYYYDYEAIKTPAKYAGITGMDLAGYKDAKKFSGKHSDKQRGHSRKHAGFNERWDKMTVKEQMNMGANKRSVWTVPTFPYPDAHFATYPIALIWDCIKAGCPEGGIVYDPFFGSGTTGIAALRLQRHFIGSELNPAYVEIAKKRLNLEYGLFNAK